MSALAEEWRRPGTYTVPEVAYVADVADMVVNREIDARVLEIQGHSGAGERLLDKPGLLYVVAIHDLRSALDRDTRSRIAASLRAGQQTLTLGRFSLSVARLKTLVRPRLSEVEALHDAISFDPAICGGEAVLRGTRIPAHQIAELLAQRATPRELQAEFGIGAGELAAARLYARLHPRRGRPRLVRRDAVVHVSADR